jgi:hypothetical protein
MDFLTNEPSRQWASTSMMTVLERYCGECGTPTTAEARCEWCGSALDRSAPSLPDDATAPIGVLETPRAPDSAEMPAGGRRAHAVRHAIAKGVLEPLLLLVLVVVALGLVSVLEAGSRPRLENRVPAGPAAGEVPAVATQDPTSPSLRTQSSGQGAVPPTTSTTQPAVAPSTLAPATTATAPAPSTVAPTTSTAPVPTIVPPTTVTSAVPTTTTTTPPSGTAAE